MRPTQEQEDIIAAAVNGKNSLLIEAFAGTGKSSTYRLLLEKMQPIRALALAFNVKNKKDMEQLFPEWVTVKTFNGLGHSAWQKATGRFLKVDDRKLGRLVTAAFKESGVNSGEDGWDTVRQLVTAAQQNGLVPSEFNRTGLIQDTTEVWKDLAELPDTNPDFIRLARQVLIESIREAMQGTISFDDQVYMSTMFDGNFERFPLVLVDESQDLNALNHLQVKRSLSFESRLFVVGDSRQAIYAFRGAHRESMSALKALRQNWQELKLSVTFRCPRVIVELVSTHAEGFTAAEGNAQGRIVDLRHRQVQTDSEAPVLWSWQDLQAEKEGRDLAVLCRNNAPLLGIAFKLIKQGVGVVMLGRDIGKGLQVLSKKLFKDHVKRDVIVALINKWRQEEIALAQVNEQESKISTIEDKADCLQAVAETLTQDETGKDLRKKLDDLFSRERGQVTLSTGHRSKGLEWDTVLHLDPFRCPSKWARQKGGTALEQELNLEYVIHTRAKRTLVFANLEEFEAA